MKNSTINHSPRNQGCQYALASRMSDLDWESELGLFMWVGLSWMSCAKLWWVEWVVWVLFSSLGLVSLWWTQFRRDYHLKGKDKNATDEEYHALHNKMRNCRTCNVMDSAFITNFVRHSIHYYRLSLLGNMIGQDEKYKWIPNHQTATSK